MFESAHQQWLTTMKRQGPDIIARPLPSFFRVAFLPQSKVSDTSCSAISLRKLISA